MSAVFNASNAPQEQTFEVTLTQEEIKSIEAVFPHLIAAHAKAPEHYQDFDAVLSILSTFLPTDVYERLVDGPLEIDDTLMTALTMARQGVEQRA